MSAHEIAGAAPADRKSRSSDPRAGAATLYAPECHAEVCITCSDQAVSARIVAVDADGLATVDAGAGPEEISVALVDARIGDTVLVHAGEAIAVVDADPAGAGA
jgi:hydrogenase maturation factor